MLFHVRGNESMGYHFLLASMEWFIDFSIYSFEGHYATNLADIAILRVISKFYMLHLNLKSMSFLVRSSQRTSGHPQKYGSSKMKDLLSRPMQRPSTLVYRLFIH